MFDELFTNRNSHADFVINAIEYFGNLSSSIKIAVAFFTCTDQVESLVRKGCDVKLVVRLGYPTSADALRRLLKNGTAQVRYFTDTSFHPKLYIFGDHAALVGSANLTDKALKTNQEIMVAIPSEDPRFDSMAVLFGEYWEDAGVLTMDIIERYEQCCRKYKEASYRMYELEQDIVKHLGRVVSRNIKRDTKKAKAEEIFLNDYRKTYQETVTAFNEVRETYELVGKRRVSSEVIPIRLEIDSFISFVREKHASGDIWGETAPLSKNDRCAKTRGLVEEWLETEWKWFDDHIVNEAYPLLRSVFDTPETLSSATNDKLFDALCVAHSFSERRRFYPGGLSKLKDVFYRQNDRLRIDDSLSYLVFGEGEAVKRMCNLIFGSAFKLQHFGRAHVQELVGWLNKEDIPVINGRTTKVLRYLGFQVRQCDSL
jgi:HKD family nuclease